MADISENPLGGQSSSAAAATSRGPKRCLIRFGNMLKGNKLISGADLNNNTGRRRSNKARISNDANNGDSNQAIEVRKKQNYFLDCHRAYSCIHCGAHLANHDELISKLFQGNHGRAYLFNKVSNIGCKQAVQRELLTGLHAVADIYCDNCETTVGWKYEQAFVPSQKYKEGKYIIELVHILKENNWDLTSYNVKALLDESMLSANKLALNDDDLTDRPSYYYSNNNNNFNRYRRLNNNYYYNRAVRLHQQHQQQQLQASTSSSSASSSTSSPKSSSLSKSLTKSDSCMDFHISHNSNNDNEEDVDATTIILGNNINNNNNININNQAGDVTNNSGVEVVALETAGTISETYNVNQQRKQSGDSLIIKIEKQPMIELKADVVRRCSNDNDETTTVLIIGANSRDNNNTNQV